MVRKQKKPSIKDVAAVAGVSTATVSHVFSGKKAVNSNLEKRVRRAADDLGYEVDRAASLLRSGRARVIAILVPDLEDLYLARLVALTEARAEDAGYEVIVACSRNDPAVERSRLRAMLAWRPAGLIAVPCSDTIPPELTAAFSETPIIGVDRTVPGAAQFDTVTVDNFGSGQKIARLFLRKQSRSILFVAATFDLFPIRERLRGVQDEAQKAEFSGLETLDIGSDPAQGADRMAEWLNENDLPDAIVGATNVVTLAILSAFAKCGLSAPEDVHLVGFHDSLWMTARRSPITTIAQPVDDVARCSWERLERRMSGDTSPVQSIILTTELLVRASTGLSDKRENLRMV